MLRHNLNASSSGRGAESPLTDNPVALFAEVAGGETAEIEALGDNWRRRVVTERKLRRRRVVSHSNRRTVASVAGVDMTQAVRRLKSWRGVL
jgi:hypothetical protein